MDWQNAIKDYTYYLQFEKAFSENTISAYIADINKLAQYLELNNINALPVNIENSHIKQFLEWAYDLGMTSKSQARVLSGIKSFFKFLVLDDIIETNPATFIDTPRIEKKLPTFLSLIEIDKIIESIDLTKAEGQRNKAIIETLYSCGLRVSELINMKLSHSYFDKQFIKITGKGDKQRLVPISNSAIIEIKKYFAEYRNNLKIKPDSEDIVFLNRRGGQLTRVMIFTIVKQLVKIANIKKNVSPHTFRHSFASHLIEGGADLRAIQEMLGHESITTTEIYTHLDREYLRSEIINFHPRS